MASEGNGFTHYLVSKEVVLGEACVIEECNEWISLARCSPPKINILKVVN